MGYMLELTEHPFIKRNIINDFKDLKKNMDIVEEQMGKSQQTKEMTKIGPNICK